jgi:hydroxymethylbilane synthase
MKKILRLGTRGSPLALVQAETVRQLLFAVHPDLEHEAQVDIVPIRTGGDWKPGQQERRFVDMGGNKGMFTKEIEEALQAGYVDMAVHSMKDVASLLPDSFELAAILERADPQDALIGREAATLAELPAGAVIGTASLRRQAQILARRPDLKVMPLLVNVDTRLRKLSEGMADATVLAVAGLARLGLESCISSIIDAKTMLPAAGQGALGIEIRAGGGKAQDEVRRLLQPLNHRVTFQCVTAERAAMRVIDGTCHTPAGALATLTPSDHMMLEALIAAPDGTGLIRLSREGHANDAEKIGADLGAELRARAPAGLFVA